MLFPKGAIMSPSEESSTTVAEGEAGESKSDHRARPGRRTVEERQQQAVLELFAGKATVDQIARRLGVLPSTVEGWRRDALGGISEALRRGSGKTTRELELEREVKTLIQITQFLNTVLS
jgi:transposase-like protein